MSFVSFFRMFSVAVGSIRLFLPLLQGDCLKQVTSAVNCLLITSLSALFIFVSMCLLPAHVDLSFSTCEHGSTQCTALKYSCRFCFCFEPINRITSEDLGTDGGRLLLVKGLQESDSGVYRCTAAYASSQKLEAHVNLTTIGALPTDLHSETKGLFSFPSLFYSH